MGQDSGHGNKQLPVQRDELVERVIEAYEGLPPQQRLMVGIAGAPASGKSTLADWLVQHINSDMSDAQPAVVVPMDGYHLDNAILDARGVRAVKGAPHTFDVPGFLSLLQRLAAQNSQADTVYIPVFDRKMDLSRCAASAVAANHRIIVIEGNYLLLNRPGWCELAEFLDLTLMLDVPLHILEQRLVQRWIDHGFDTEAATNRALSNDIPNARVVTLESSASHLVLTGVRQ